MKILFYTSIPRLFRSTGIGHLYELAQVYSVILLSEKLDPLTEKVITNKKLFPHLEKIIPSKQYTDDGRNIVMKHYHFSRFARTVISLYKPSVVMADDLHPFELYLMRYATKIGALKLSLQLGIQPAPMEEYALFPLWRSIYTTLPSLPLWIRVFLIKARKRLAHFLTYWCLPLLIGELPFIGKSSFILWKGDTGLRETDYYMVFSKRERDLCIQAGVPQKKLYILTHPFLHKRTRKFLEQTYRWSALSPKPSWKKSIVVMLPAEDIGIKKSNYSLISKEDTMKYRTMIISLLLNVLKGWQIIIKPHPAVQNFRLLKETFTALSPTIIIGEPQEPAEKYIASCEVIIGFAPASTTLFTATLQCPEKPIISLDLHRELLGDTYKGFEGIEYIDNEKHLVNILISVRNGTYKKEPIAPYQADFYDTVQAVKYLTNIAL